MVQTGEGVAVVTVHTFFGYFIDKKQTELTEEQKRLVRDLRAALLTPEIANCIKSLQDTGLTVEFCPRTLRT